MSKPNGPDHTRWGKSEWERWNERVGSFISLYKAGAPPLLIAHSAEQVVLTVRSKWDIILWWRPYWLHQWWWEEKFGKKKQEEEHETEHSG